jgi:hypothetical protein
MQVLELDADHRPGAAAFTISIPAGAEVKYNDKPGFFRLKQDETINVLDLPELFDMADKAPTQPLMDTGLTHRRSWPWAWIGIAGGVLLLVVGVFVRAWRHRQAPGSLACER